MTKENDQKLNDEILAKINELVTIYNLNNDESQLKVIKEQRIDSIVT